MTCRHKKGLKADKSFSPLVTFNLGPFEAKIILFEFLFSEVGEMRCSVHGCALTTHRKENCAKCVVAATKLISLKAKVCIWLHSGLHLLSYNLI